ncbi:MAG: hypothetical protein IT221_05460 [Fluviicola sp.]|nr:hypothetical protein [Fluviicola sp.]
MKTRLLLAGLGLLAMFNMQAQRTTHTGGFINTSSVDYYDEPIQFEERNIMFYVFLNGDFDFNTEPTVQVDYVYRRGNQHQAAPRGIRIERDAQGRIRRIGNVFISYTFDGQVKRIGSVFISYFRDRMDKVGNLSIIYGRYGISFMGSVKGYYSSYNPHYSSNWTSFNDGHYVTWEYGYYDSFFNTHDFYNDYESFNEDDQYYYFKSKDSGKNDAQIIKRKKENLSTRNETRRQID